MGYQFHHAIQGDRTLPVVLFLHGFLGDCRDFEAAIALLSKRFCCLTVDLPGHGQTEVRGNLEQYTMPRTAQAIVAWLDQLAIPQSFLVGYSMGGRLALYLALHFPQRFPRVVLESASPGLELEHARQTRSQQDWILADLLESDFPAFLSDWYHQPLFDSLYQSANFEQILTRRAQNRPAALAQSLRALSTGQQPSLWTELEQHRQPLLLMVGERDRKFCEINQEMTTRCPTAQLEIMPACGHTIHLEHPEAFSEHVSSFLC